MSGTDDERDRGADWSEWVGTAPVAGLGGAALAAVGALVGGTDGPAGTGSDDHDDLDVDHDGDVDLDDVTQQTTDNLLTGVTTGTLIMSNEGAGQAQLDVIDAIYGND